VAPKIVEIFSSPWYEKAPKGGVVAQPRIYAEKVRDYPVSGSFVCPT
jgi:hypothetical protein